MKIARILAVLGLGVLAGGPATAATVSQDVGFTFGTSYGGRNHDFDIDGDGTDDVRLYAYYSSSYGSSGGGSSSGLTISGLNGSLIAAGGPLAEGDAIGGDVSFVSSQSMIGHSSWWSRSCSRWGGCRTNSGANHFGAWTNGDTTSAAGFLGIGLAGSRYGWMELDLSYLGGGTLLSHGYETEADRSVLAGAATSAVPATGDLSAVPLPAPGILLAGALAGLALRRRS